MSKLITRESDVNLAFNSFYNHTPSWNFMKNFPIRKSSTNLEKVMPSQAGLGIAQGFMEIIKARQQYLQFKETEITKRVQIKKNAEIDIADIRERAQLLRDYFIMSFSERRENFDRCLYMLDSGLNSGNDKQIDAALSLMVAIIKESPLKQATDVMLQIRSRTGNEIIEI